LWIDSWDDRSRLETFVAQTLVAWADSTLRTRAALTRLPLLGPRVDWEG